MESVQPGPLPPERAARPKLLSRRTMLGGAALAGLGVALGLATAEYKQHFGPKGNRARTAHLLRRAGFGASAPQLDHYQSLGLAGATDELLNCHDVPNDPLENMLDHLHLDVGKPQDLQRWWLLRMIYTNRPLEEKMTLFWHGLLTSGLEKSSASTMYEQNKVLRELAMGSFRNLLIAVTHDPAMLRWLDLATSTKKAPNENYARELMELFTMGLGNYTQTDVQEAARAFTGWKLRPDHTNPRPRSLVAYYNSHQHDGGPKTFLGHTGNFTDVDIIDILVQQPATAKFIARKLWSFFVYDNPDDATLKPLIDTYFSSIYNIGAMMKVIVNSPAFYSDRAYRAKVKSPVEYVAGIVRQMEIKTDGKYLPFATTSMGQTLFAPPNVAGWPGGPTWLNSDTWLNRINFNNLVTVLPHRDFNHGYNSIDIQGMINREKIESATQLVDHLLGVLVDGHVSDSSRQALLDYATDGITSTVASSAPAEGKGTGSPITHHALKHKHIYAFAGDNGSIAAKQAQGLFYLALSMPEYHLA